jgi:hypothetical protein
LVEEATDCQAKFVGAPVCVQVAPKFVDTSTGPPSPKPSSYAAAVNMLPSAEQASDCHSKSTEAPVSVQLWAKAGALARSAEQAAATLRTKCFDGKSRCQSSGDFAPHRLAAL